MSLFVLWLACGGSPEPAEFSSQTAPSADKASAKPAEPVPRRVWASSLNVRSKPDAASDVARVLAVNSVVLQQSVDGEWSAIGLPLEPNVGFVKTEFLHEDALTLDACNAELAAQTDPKQRLAWAQRAAALAPEQDTVLDTLEQAYRALEMDAMAGRVARQRAEQSTRYTRWFSASVRRDASNVALRLEKSPRAVDLIAAHTSALSTLDAMSASLQAKVYDASQHDVVDRLTQEHLPWAEVQWYAEGTAAILEPLPEPWLAAAKRTPEPLDDAYFAFLQASYGNLRGEGWGMWQERTWDYGGCSPFGRGLHLSLLKQAQELTDPAVAKVVTRIRGEVLADIQGPHGEFTFCDPGEPGGDTDPAKLVAEATQILAEVSLSTSEKAAIQARIDANFAPVGD